MNYSGLLKGLVGLAEPLGYRRKAGLFWFAGDELTRLIQIQRSKWGGGVYVNFGATPNRMITKPIPPGTGYWGLELRPTSWRSPHFKEFLRCESDHDNEMDPSAMLEPLRWLLHWIDQRWDDADLVRRAVLRPGSLEAAHSSIMMKDWAKGRLRTPRHYFAETRYYR